MEIRFQRIFLAATSITFVLAMSFSAHATSTMANMSFAPFSSETETETVEVDVKTEHVLEDILDNENFELGVQFGLLSIEDFESSPWVSAHFAYHITEYFYAKALYGTAEGGLTSFERLVNVPPLLTDEQRKLKYYGLNIGYNLMPGEIFLGRDLAFNSLFSIELGGGNTEFAGDEKFTINIGANYRVFVTDWLTWDIGMSDYIFDTQITGTTKTTHNLNFTTGFAVYF